MMLSRVRALGPTNIFFSDVRLAGFQPPTGEIHFCYDFCQLTGQPDAERGRCHGLFVKEPMRAVGSYPCGVGHMARMLDLSRRWSAVPPMIPYEIDRLKTQTTLAANY